jgi:ElaB/YqjD/DUF883 family membrane-anchored ribosome-binding protein
MLVAMETLSPTREATGPTSSEEILPMETTTTSPSPSLDPRVVSQQAQAGIDRLKDSAHETVERAAQAASSTAERLGARSEQWLASKDEWIGTARGYVRDHPVAALAMALAAGYLLSRLTQR